MRTINEEIVEESERPTQIDGISAHRTRKEVVAEATKQSEFGIPGQRYDLRVTKYAVTDRAGRTLEIEGWRYSVIRRYHVWLALLERVDGSLPIAEQENLVPVRIAVLGKPELVAYLYVVHELEREEVGEIMGISRQTVKQYLSDISRGRRKKD